MKLITMFMLISTLTFTCFAQNLVKNGNFQGDLSWNTQSAKKDDCTFAFSDSTLTIAVQKGGYFLRVYQDVPVSEGKRYLLTYRGRKTGKGAGMVNLQFGKPDGTWCSEAPTVYLPRIESDDWQDISQAVIPEAGADKMRITFAPAGSNTSVSFQAVSVIEQSGASRTIPAIPSAAVIDGSLSEACWQDALVLDNFSVFGSPEKKASVQTKVLLFCRDGFLYIGVRASEPDIRSLSTAVRRDGLDVWSDDTIEIFFSPDQSAFNQLLINPLGFKGSKRAGYLKKEDLYFKAWHQIFDGKKLEFTGSWEMKTHIGANEWVLEGRMELAPVFSGIDNTSQIYCNVARRNPSRPQEEYTSWTGMHGKSLLVPALFQPLALPNNAVPKGVNHARVRQKLDSFSYRLEHSPELLLPGTPLSISRGSGVCVLPSAITVSGDALIGQTARGMLTETLACGNGPALTVTCTADRLPSDGIADPVLKAKLENKEAYRLDIEPNAIRVSAGTVAGLNRGVASLIMIARGIRYRGESSIPCVSVRDAPGFRFRGWQINKTKKIADVIANIDIAFLLRYNYVFIPLDDWGANSFFPFESHPGISDNQTTKAALAAAFDRVRELGMVPVAYHTSWGRAGAITRKEQYKKFAVNPTGTNGAKGTINLDIANPEAVQLMNDLQKEMIDTLRVDNFHIALDEVQYDAMISPLGKEKGWNEADAFVAYANSQAAFFKDLGIRLFIWGDMLDPDMLGGSAVKAQENRMLERLDKDIVIMDWKYDGRFDSMEEYPSISMFMNAGFKTIGCPWWNQQNVANVIKSSFKANASGVCETSWVPDATNTIYTEYMRAVPLAAYLAWSPYDCDLSHLSVLPEILYKAAAGILEYPSTKPTSRTIPRANVQGTCVSGEAFIEALGLKHGDLGFIPKSLRTERAVTMEPFFDQTGPCALMLRGRKHSGVQNGSFSTSLANWEQQSGNKDDSRITVDSGTLVIQRKRGNYQLRAYQDIAVTPGKKYVLSMRIKKQGKGYGSASVQFGKPDGTFIGNAPSLYLPKPEQDDWQTVSMEFPVPAEANKFRLSLAPVGEDTTAYFDDVVLREQGDTAGTMSAVICIDSKARALSFLHSLNKQPIDDLHMNQIIRSYKNVVAGTYAIAYEDGSEETVVLLFRDQIVDWNDRYIGRRTDVGIFGTAGNGTHINVPVFTWRNPYPDKIIKSITCTAPAREDMTFFLLGVTCE